MSGKEPSFPFYYRRYLTSGALRDMTDTQQAVYVRALCHLACENENGKGLPSDEGKLCKILACTMEDVKVVKKWMHEVDGYVFNKNLTDSMSSSKKTKKDTSPKKAYSPDKNVTLTDGEHERLVAEYGKHDIEGAILKLSQWKLTHPRYRPSSDNRALRKWAIRAFREQGIDTTKTTPSTQSKTQTVIDAHNKAVDKLNQMPD